MRLVKAFAKEGVEMRSYSHKVEDVFKVANKEVLGRSFFYMMVTFLFCLLGMNLNPEY